LSERFERSIQIVKRGHNMPIMHLKDADIYYESRGTGKPPLVFIHGYTCDHTDWEFQVERLSKTNQVITCDLRGHGQSTGGGSHCTIEDLAKDTGNLIKSLNLQHVVLIGHSMGGPVVLETFMQNPQLVAGIVTIDSSAQGARDAKNAMETIKKSIDSVSYPTYVRKIFGTMFFGNQGELRKNRIIERAASLNPQFGTALRVNLAGWSAVKMETALSALNIPLLFIQSTNMNANNERYSLTHGEKTPSIEFVRRLVPKARIEVIPGHGHFVMLEAPDRTNELIASFVTQFNTTDSQ
jgi:pimeloyl-ACP methyl ester carboxylesterase